MAKTKQIDPVTKLVGVLREDLKNEGDVFKYYIRNRQEMISKYKVPKFILNRAIHTLRDMLKHEAAQEAVAKDPKKAKKPVAKKPAAKKPVAKTKASTAKSAPKKKAGRPKGSASKTSASKTSKK